MEKRKSSLQDFDPAPRWYDATAHPACLHPDSIPLLPRQSDNERMSKKEHVMKLVDEKAGLMECLVCGEKRHAVMKPGPDGKFLPENWECVNMCRLIHHDEKTAKKSGKK